MSENSNDRIIARVGFVITVLAFVFDIFIFCSQKWDKSNIEHSETTEISIAIDGSSEISSVPSFKSDTKDEIPFAKKWEERKIRFNEVKGGSFKETFVFFLSYFPGLNIIFFLLITVPIFVYVIKEDGFDFSIRDCVDFFPRILLLVTILFPIFWCFIFC